MTVPSRHNTACSSPEAVPGGADNPTRVVDVLGDAMLCSGQERQAGEDTVGPRVHKRPLLDAQERRDHLPTLVHAVDLIAVSDRKEPPDSAAVPHDRVVVGNRESFLTCPESGRDR